VLTSCTKAILQGKEEVLFYERKVAVSLILKQLGCWFSCNGYGIDHLIALTDAEVDFIQILFEVVSALPPLAFRLGSRQVYQYLLSWS